MGATPSATASHIKEEFSRITSNNNSGRAYLTLDEMVQFQAKDRDHQVDPTHLGTLFVMDVNRDGQFELDEVIKLGQLYSERAAANKLHTEFQTQFQAYCTLHLWNEVSKSGGVDLFADWFCVILQSNPNHIQYFPSHEGTVFLHRDIIKILHNVNHLHYPALRNLQILSINTTYGLDLQAFFDLLQRVAEEQGIMKITEVELDDYVPLDVVKQFARDFITGFINLMKELGFQPDMKIE